MKVALISRKVLKFSSLASLLDGIQEKLTVLVSILRF